jgi:hypothetical protein
MTSEICKLARRFGYVPMFFATMTLQGRIQGRTADAAEFTKISAKLDDGLSSAVGNTPLIYLRSVSEATGCKIYGKAEFMNPTASVKDRAAKAMIDAAEAAGKLKPGTTRTFPATGRSLFRFKQPMIYSI